MSYKNYKNILLLLILINGSACIQKYIPPNIKGDNSYLVVDGPIINGQDSTVINLSRAQSINDSSSYYIIPETGAVINVVGENGDSYLLTEQGSGRYATDHLDLNVNELYRLKIATSNGNQYLSDSMVVKKTPPIDSVSWQFQDDGVHIYVNTHDPQNNTRYYRWKNVQTWEYHSPYNSGYIFLNGIVVQRDSTEQEFACWKTVPSTNLILGSSAKLASDIIYQQPIAFIPLNAQQLSVEYSIIVSQYALTADAYFFYQLLQQNTEESGSLFDPQPSQLTGNIHNIANPKEVVLGFASASSVQQQRIFISNSQVLSVWSYPNGILECPLKVVTLDSSSFYFGNSYVPVYADLSSSGILIGYYSAFDYCVECTEQGGINVKPPYWP
jgi:hypothetical protein